MLKLSCLCGQIRIEIDQQPEYINACNCALCSKSGAHWAYLDPSGATVHGNTRGYTRTDKADPGAEVHFCTNCGATTHFVLTPSAIAKFGNTMMGVNMRLADDQDLAGVERRYPDGRTWQGEGAFGYVRAAEIIGAVG
ncbi:MAG: aldehyde-activating protein [Novosphingobium sp.]|nr:aldehyde-activating protein [Novosphingobium sp.]